MEAGLDVADTGNDQNAEALRSGPELFDIDRWYGSMAHGPAWTARKARKKATDNGCTRFYYDIGGPGAGIRDPLREDDPNDPDNPAADFPVQGCQFGSSPQSPDVPFVRGRDPKTNGEYFFNWAAQAGWALRMRADMTQRLVNGEDVDPHNCLFINPAIPKLQDVLANWPSQSGTIAAASCASRSSPTRQASKSRTARMRMMRLSWRFAQMRGVGWCREIKEEQDGRQ